MFLYSPNFLHEFFSTIKYPSLSFCLALKGPVILEFCSIKKILLFSKYVSTIKFSSSCEYTLTRDLDSSIDPEKISIISEYLVSFKLV